MFTGLIEGLGTLAASESRGGDRRLRFAAGSLAMGDVNVGDSICVNGVCLTAVAVTVAAFDADVSGETLDRTTLGGLTIGAAVNLEKALLPTSRLGGHLVSGHVDGVGDVAAFEPDARSARLTIAAPPGLGRYIAEKGSICVDGVSLTVNGVAQSTFHVNVVPHTLRATTIGAYRRGWRVNLEVDIIARYLERLTQADGQRTGAAPGLAERALRERGISLITGRKRSAVNDLNSIEGDFLARDARLAIAAARFNGFIVNSLVDGAVDACKRHGVDVATIDLVWVPGAFELPLVVKKLARSGRYDGIIALGAVLRGATPHFEYVAGECSKGLGAVSLGQELPVGFGVLTVDTIEQAVERAGTKAGNKGFDAALTVLEMISLLAKLEARPASGG